MNKNNNEKKSAAPRAAAANNNNTTTSRRLGTAVPVGALRGKDGLGVGEFLDLVEFAQFCARSCIGLIQLLPVNDTGYESSPYSALSAFALNPLYLKLSRLDEAAGFEGKIALLRTRFDGAKRFPHREVVAAKIALLREMFAPREGAIAASPALKTWIDANGWVKTYAVFRSLKEANKLRHWKEWESHGTAAQKDIDALWKEPARATEHRFWAWVQYNLDAQFRAARTEIAQLGIILEGDLPILINEDSADVWAHGQYFDNAYSAGAPPDMYSPDGQNWGFPIYNWDALEKDGCAWWKERLAAAEKYFDAYRIDHVLGFFRIWATPRTETSALLGRFIPSVPISRADLHALGFDRARIRWLSLPHVPTRALRESLQSAGGGEEDLTRITDAALRRIGDEELWLFKETIRGGGDIEALDIHPAGKKLLHAAWADRVLQPIDADNYAPLWNHQRSHPWATLSAEEKDALEDLIRRKDAESERTWESAGTKHLAMLKDASPMLPCAEDLGAVPPCVPSTLAGLNILGLRVVRWTRRWEQDGGPYIPFSQYPELSVCTPAVHDSSTVREWWENEADQNAFAAFLGQPSLPPLYNPGAARRILRSVAGAASRYRVFQIQDLLHLSPRWYAPESASERVNIPGTAGEFNWTYRLPAPIGELLKDDELIARIQELSAV
jgi:4-alpha-glucanotransferase